MTREAHAASVPVRTLADALRRWDDDELTRLLTTRPDLARPTPADVGQLAARAAGRTSVTFALDRLDTAHITVVEAMTTLPPPISVDDVHRVVPGAAASVTRVLAGLRDLALVWGDDGDLRLVRAVHELVGPAPGGRPAIHQPVDEPPVPETTRRDPAVVDRAGAGAAYELVRRVELLLEAWGAAPPAVLRAGGVGVRDVRAMSTRLGVSDADVGLLVEVAHAAGLLSVGDDPEVDEVWLPTADFDRWQAVAPAQRWVRLATAWLTTPRATVLVGERDDRDRPINPLTPDLTRGGAAAVRAATLHVLAAAGTGAAVADPDQVVAAVAWTRPRRAVLRDLLVRRTLVEAGTIGVTAMAALTGPGRALLTDADAAAGLLDRLLPEPVDHVLIQGDLTAVAPGPLAPQVARGLALVADVESRGGATVYRFTAQSVRRALDAGWPASQVHEFVTAHSRTPVPQPLTYLVDDAARRHGRLRVGAGSVYVRADDPAELDVLLADSALAPLHLRRVAPTVALSDVPADVVLDRLRRAGRAPLLEGADGRAVSEGGGDRRARVRRPPRVDTSTLDLTAAAAVVVALRAGERAAAVRPPDGRVPGPTHLLAELRAAVDDERTVWLAYLDDTGTRSERVVDPLDIEDGRLTAFDHRSARTRTFALHRISQVSGVET